MLLFTPQEQPIVFSPPPGSHFGQNFDRWMRENLYTRSSKSIEIGIDLSIDKSDFIDIDCVDQPVEIDGTLVLFTDLSWFLPILSIYIGR